MTGQKKEPWRIIAATFAIAYIAYTWIKKDILSLYRDMPAEQMLPMLVTTVGVALLKVALLALGIRLFKKIASKYKEATRTK